MVMILCKKIEEGTTTTPFDMTVLNRLDRFHLAMDVIDRIVTLRETAADVRQVLTDKLTFSMSRS